MRSSIGTPKARVLPEPVGDLASTSVPARMSPMMSFWMANGSVKPRLARAADTALDTPRSAKDCDDIGMLQCGIWAADDSGRLLTRTALWRDPSELPRGGQGRPTHRE